MPRLRFSRPGAANPETPEDLRFSAGPQAPQSPAAPPPTPTLTTATGDDRELIEQVQARLLSDDDLASRKDPEYFARRIAELVADQIDVTGRVASERERNRLTRVAQAELLGFGPLDALLADDTISEIMVNGPDQVWIERGGRLHETDVRFADDDHVRKIIDRIISPLGRRCDESSPMVDARLPDGSRVNAIVPPLCLNGPTMTIRKFFKKPLSANDLIAHGSATAELVEFLRACVQGRLNIIVSGGTGTGKTTMLNMLSSFIAEDERILTIENAAELQLQQRHVITLEFAPGQYRGTWRGQHPRPGDQLAAYAARPDRGGRVPLRRNAGYAPGDEYRPRRLDDHAARQ